MKLSKQYVGRIVLGVEIIVYAGFYFLGANGVHALEKMKQDILFLEEQVVHLKDDISYLQTTIALHEKNPFFQEKIAREQLQMARAQEEIYLITEAS